MRSIFSFSSTRARNSKSARRLCDIAAACLPALKAADKPVLLSWLGGSVVAEARRATHAAGLPAAAGIARTPLLALLAARRSAPGGVTRVEDETTFLSPLPVEAAGPPPALVPVLAAWGVRTLGALNALPLADLQAIDARIDDSVYAALSVDASVAARASYGGTAPDQVRLQVARAAAELGMEK